MNIIRILDIVFIICLLIVGIETIIKFRKSKTNLTEKVKDELIMRFNIITGLSIILFILNLIMIIFK